MTVRTWHPAISRRNFGRFASASFVAPLLQSLVTGGAEACPIAWQPSAFAPVFYGYRDCMAPIGSRAAPVPCRVFYPSLDGSPDGAQFLSSCRKYPLILFVHGQCAEPEHYKRWSKLAAQLARSGYIVAIPQWPGTHPWDADYLMLARLRAWMFAPPAASDAETGRVWAGQIDFRTGIAGHSYGALLAARLFSLSAFVSIDGVWDDWPSMPANPIFELFIPKLFFYGERGGGVIPSFWPRLRGAKHRVEFTGARHWDYLRAGVSSCERDQGRGACNLVEAFTVQTTVWFMAKHLPPLGWERLRADIPDTLLPPRPTLTREQAFFAGAHPATTPVTVPSGSRAK